jgi:hypothetical protein
MPTLFTPEIEDLINTQPLLYEVLNRTTAAISSIPVYSGTGSPEGKITAAPNSLYLQQDSANPGLAMWIYGGQTAGSVGWTNSGTYGSSAPTWSGLFVYATTTTTISLYWDGTHASQPISVYGSDGSIIQKLSGSITVTGLTNATPYYFYPYYDKVRSVLGWAGSTVGGVGNPPYALTAKSNAAAAVQGAVGFSPLSVGGMTITTGAGGSGSVGGSGTCLREGMLVDCKERGIVPVETCTVGDHIQGYHDWTKIVKLVTIPCGTFIRVTVPGGNFVEVTPSHPFTLPTGRHKEAQDLSLSDVLIGTPTYFPIEQLTVVTIQSRKVSLSCLPEHEFFSGGKVPNILTHNTQVSS